jgi:hypothetical protein
MPLAPARVALASTVDASVSGSTEITLNAATTFIRVYAKSQDVYMKWGTTDVTASNSDAIIPAGQIVDFVLPVNQGALPLGTLYTAVNFIEETAGAKLTVYEY